VPLKSALRGGREKYGMPQKKLTVTWAHDVYDPPVRLVFVHSVKGGHSHHRSSRSSWKSSSSNSSKHKHKRGKSTSRSTTAATLNHVQGQLNAEIGRSTSLLNAMSTSELSDFSLGARARVLPDNTKCGTSYFMKSLTELHLPVA
ncbi:hypothetical protein MKW92_001517, partial [Papaver armeniacum]